MRHVLSYEAYHFFISSSFTPLFIAIPAVTCVVKLRVSFKTSSLPLYTPGIELPQSKTLTSATSFYSSSSLAVLCTQYVHICHEMEHIYLHCTCGERAVNSKQRVRFHEYIHTYIEPCCHTTPFASSVCHVPPRQHIRHMVVLFVLALHCARYRDSLKSARWHYGLQCEYLPMAGFLYRGYVLS